MAVIRTSKSEQSLSSIYSSQKRAASSSNTRAIKRLRFLSAEDDDVLPARARVKKASMMTALPYRPSDEEKDWYFFGLAGRPKLIARTGSDRWTLPKVTGPFTYCSQKRFSAICDQQIISKWTKQLSFDLIKALDRCKWTYFFPIRIGFADDPPRCKQNIERLDFPIILLIAVEKNSLEWGEGVGIALHCRRILQQYQISGVEVEIREGRHEHFAASKELDNKINPCAWGWDAPETNRQVQPFLSLPGYPLTYHGQRETQGTVGLHVKLQNESPTFYGLTCRHVVDSNRASHESYKISENVRQYHVQGNNRAFEDSIEQLNELEHDLQFRINPLIQKKEKWEMLYQHEEDMGHRRFTDEDAKKLDDLEKKASYHRDIVKLLESIEDQDLRKIGHLAYHPTLESSIKEPGYFTDWALVELDREKFPLGPQNKVFVGSTGVKSMSRFRKLLANDLSHIEDGFLTLKLEKRAEEDEKGFYVGKHGCTTGFTLGVKSGIEAVIRKNTPDGVGRPAWEMLVVPEDKKSHFSERGDSGSCVFDIEGRVIGILNGSVVVGNGDDHGWRGLPQEGSNSRRLKKHPGGKVGPEEAAEETAVDLSPEWINGTDVTFVSPIEWVLQDIERFTGQKPQLA